MTVSTAMLGLPASGKTSAAQNINKRLNEAGLYSIVVPEAARMVLEAEEKNRPTAEDELKITQYQSQLEQMAKRHDPDVIVGEQIPSITEAYIQTYFPDRQDLANEILAFEEQHDYDIVFHTEPLEYKDDGTRYQTPDDLKTLEAHLNRHARKYDTVWLPDGEETRVDQMYFAILEELTV